MEWTAPISEDRVDSYRDAGYWQDETLDDRFLAASELHPEKTAIVDPRGRTSYGELADTVARLAGGLRDLGVGHGDVVSVQLPNWREFVAVHLAATRLGAITNPLLHQYREGDLRKMLSKVEPRLAVVPRSFGNYTYPELWSRLRRDLDSLQHVLVVDPGGDAGSGTALQPYESVISAGEPVRDAFDGSSDDVTLVIFTSGTVASKGVMHTHNTSLYGIRTYVDELGLTGDNVVWMPSPISHGTGLQWGVRTAVYLGSTLVLQDTWDPVEAVHLIRAEACSVTMGATPFVHDLVEAANAEDVDLRPFDYFVCAGAPIPRELGHLVRELKFQLLGAYGMSEHFVSTICRPEDPEDKRLSTDGRPLPGTDVAVFGEDREQQRGVGELGELAVRGPGVAVGYHRDLERTAEAFRDDGWQFTDDMAVIDDSGYVTISGRIKDMIIRGGLNISPSEVESLLFEHPKIGQVAIVGYPDERLGERACAFVVPSDPGDAPELDELVEFLLGQGLSKFKLPERLEVVESLPQTASGKVRKVELRTRLEQA